MATTNTTNLNSQVLKNAGIAIVIATVINVIIYYIGTAIDTFDSDVINPLTDSELAVTDVIMSTIMFLAIGTIVYFLVQRFTENTKTNFRNLAVGGYILSLLNPTMIDDIEALTYIFLLSMHTVSAIVFVYFLVYKK